MKLKNKMGNFKEGFRGFSKINFKKKYKRGLSIILSGAVLSTVMLTSFSSNVSASPVEEINSKYSTILELTDKLDVSTVKDVASYNTALYILKTDGSVISIPSSISGIPEMNSIIELYSPGSVEEFLHIKSSTPDNAGVILKHTNGDYTVIGKDGHPLLDFNKSKKIENIRLFENLNTSTNSIAIFYEDGTSNFRGNINNNFVNFDFDNLDKVYVNENGRSVYFLLTNRTVKATGSSYYGQFGVIIPTTSTTLHDVPVIDVVDIKTGPNNAYFYLSDNSIVGMGNSKYGQLGNTVESNVTPVTVPVKASEIDDMLITNNASYFLLKDNTIDGLGNSQYGNLGNINTINSNRVKLPVNSASQVYAYGDTVLLLIGEDLFGLGRSSNGELGSLAKTSAPNPTPVSIEGKYSKILSISAAITTNGSASIRYKVSTNSYSTYDIPDFKGEALRGSTLIDAYINTSNVTIVNNSSNGPVKSVNFLEKLDKVIYAESSDSIIYKSDKGDLIHTTVKSGVVNNFYISSYFYKVNSYFNALKYLEIVEITGSQEDLELAKKYLEEISSNEAYKSSLITRYDTVKTKVNAFYNAESLITSLESNLSETEYTKAVNSLDSVDGVMYKEGKETLKARLDVVKSKMDAILKPVETAVSNVEKSLDFHEYKDAISLTNKLDEGFSTSKESFITRLNNIYPKTLNKFEEYCDTLVSRAERSKLQSDIDNAYDEVILLPLSSSHRNGFLTRLGLNNIGGTTNPGTGDTSNPGDNTGGNTPGTDNPEQPKPEDPNNGAGGEIDTPITSSSSVKSNIINILSDISSQVDNSPNAVRISQIKLNLSIVSGEISNLAEDDSDKAVLQARYDNLVSKVDEVSSYYSNAYTKAESMVSVAESDKSRESVVSAYKYVKRLPEGIQKSSLLDRLDLISVN